MMAYNTGKSLALMCARSTAHAPHRVVVDNEVFATTTRHSNLSSPFNHLRCLESSAPVAAKMAPTDIRVTTGSYMTMHNGAGLPAAFHSCHTIFMHGAERRVSGAPRQCCIGVIANSTGRTYAYVQDVHAHPRFLELPTLSEGRD